MKFNKTTIESIEKLMVEYISNLSSPFDSFLEDHIQESIFYNIIIDEKLVGYFSIHNGNKLTQFFITKSHLKYSQTIFDKVIKEYNIKEAFVPTCDELFLSLALDKDVLIEKQAYFFQDSELDLSDKIYSNGTFRLATLSDYDKIIDVSKDFFDKLEERIKSDEIFVFTEGETLLGAGIIEKGRVLKKHTSIGMFTNEDHRQKGIGRTIIINLRKWCYENDLIPVCGCWYYNHNSKRTLESAGMITKTRLLNIKFTTKKD